MTTEAEKEKYIVEKLGKGPYKTFDLLQFAKEQTCLACNKKLESVGFALESSKEGIAVEELGPEKHFVYAECYYCHRIHALWELCKAKPLNVQMEISGVND